MMTILAILVFTGAFGVAVYAIGVSVVPEFDHIVDALFQRPPAVSARVRAERRLAVRHWSAAARLRTEVPAEIGVGRRAAA